MKILYTITKSEIGGAQVHVAQLARQMKDAGHSVAIASSPNGWLEWEATKIGIRFYPNPYFGNSFNPVRLIKSFSLIKKILSEFRPDLVHTHSSFAGIVTRLVIRNRIPTIFTAHSWAFTDGASIFRKIIASVSERIAARWAKKIICVSEYDKQLALRYKIAPQEKLITIHNGIEDNPYRGAVKENIIVANGRLAYPKEYLLLLKAYKLSDSILKLEIISDGPDRLTIEAKITALGLKDRVTLLGDLSSREEVQKKLSKAKIFILISKHEGMPLSILEAMSTGLPIIASNVGGIPEEIDKSCGILVRNKKEDIVNALQTLSNPFIQKEMGEAAKKRFERLFTLEKFFEKTESVYLSLVGENNLHRL